MILSNKNIPKHKPWQAEFIKNFDNNHSELKISLVIWDRDEQIILKQLEFAHSEKVDFILSDLLPDELPAIATNDEYHFFNERFFFIKTNLHLQLDKPNHKNAILFVSLKSSIVPKWLTLITQSLTESKDFVIDENQEDWIQTLSTEIASCKKILCICDNPVIMLLISRIAKFYSRKIFIYGHRPGSIFRYVAYDIQNLFPLGGETDHSIRQCLNRIIDDKEYEPESRIDNLYTQDNVSKREVFFLDTIYKCQDTCDHIASNNFSFYGELSNKLLDTKLNRYELHIITSVIENHLSIINEFIDDEKINEIIDSIIDNYLFRCDDYLWRKSFYNILSINTSINKRIFNRTCYWVDCTHYKKKNYFGLMAEIISNYNHHNKFGWKKQLDDVSLMFLEKSNAVGHIFIKNEHEYVGSIISFLESNDTTKLTSLIDDNNHKDSIKRSNLIKVMPSFLNTEQLLQVCGNHEIKKDEILTGLLRYEGIYFEDFCLNYEYISENRNIIMETLALCKKLNISDSKGSYLIDIINFALNSKEEIDPNLIDHPLVLNIALLQHQKFPQFNKSYLEHVNHKKYSIIQIITYLSFCLICNQIELFNYCHGLYVDKINEFINTDDFINQHMDNPFLFTCLYILLSELNDPRHLEFRRHSENLFPGHFLMVSFKN